jgi:hypothetical protein
MTVPASARTFIAVALGATVALSCGDSLSSLDGVQSGVREIYDMHLVPNYGERGKTVLVTVADMEEDLELLLADDEFYPYEISFGEGTHWKTYGKNQQNQIQIEVAISPFAETGKREPSLVLWVGHEQKLVEVRGSFWIALNPDE